MKLNQWMGDNLAMCCGTTASGHLFKGPELSPNPTRRRHAFKLGACTVVTVFNLCIPSLLLALWSRRGRREAMPA